MFRTTTTTTGFMLQVAGRLQTPKNSHTPSCKRKTRLQVMLPLAKQTECRVVLHIGNVNAEYEQRHTL